MAESVENNELAEKIFSLLKGNGLQVKIFDEAGAETTDPSTGRRFFVAKPNIMVTIDAEDNNVEFSKGANVDNSINELQKTIRRYADTNVPPMNFAIKIFGNGCKTSLYLY